MSEPLIMRRIVNVQFLLKPGVDDGHFTSALDAFMSNRYVEDPDKEIENRIFITESVERYGPPPRDDTWLDAPT